MSKWRFGCGKKITVWIPRGMTGHELQVECGSTAVDGGVNQCRHCESERPAPAGREDETDDEYDARASSYGDF